MAENVSFMAIFQIREYLLKRFLLNNLLMMNNKPKTLVVILSLSLILCLMVSVNIDLTFCSETSGGKIDVFTQKEPFSGRGLNVSSDAFSPEEEVIIHALVTYNNYPVQQAQVALEIHGPENPVSNITLFGYAQTDDAGIGRFSYRIGLKKEINFGLWEVIGTVYLVDKVFQDYLFFKVGWIAEIISIRTINENNTEQTRFAKGASVGVELLIRNIAMVPKKATIAMTIYDFLNIPINSTQIEDYEVPANGSIISIRCFMVIPKWATGGDAKVSACLFTAPISLGGVPYSPDVSKHFLIVFHDIGISNVKVFPTVVYKGETVSIDVTVKNHGEEIESFNTYAYYDQNNLIGETYVYDLVPNATITLPFSWNTSLVPEGFYPISASSPLQNDNNILDNTFVDDIVQVKSSYPALKFYLTVSTDPSGIVSIPGEGWYNEDTNITLTAPNYVLVSPGIRYMFSFWDVDGRSMLGDSIIVKMDDNHTATAHYTRQYYLTVITDPPDITLILGEGWYDESVAVVLSAPALSNYTFEYWDVNGFSQNNKVNPITIYMDAPQTATAHYSGPAKWFAPEWLYWFMFPLLILIITLLAIWLYRRRRKKAEEAFFSGWTAWYYCYDIKNKTRKPPL
jgi:hypothetical protein